MVKRTITARVVLDVTVEYQGHKSAEEAMAIALENAWPDRSTYSTGNGDRYEVRLDLCESELTSGSAS